MAAALLVDEEPSVFERAFASLLHDLSAPVVEIAAITPGTGESPVPRGRTLAVATPPRPSVTANVDGTCRAEDRAEAARMAAAPRSPGVPAPVVNGAAVITTADVAPASAVSTPEQTAVAPVDAGRADRAVDATESRTSDSSGSAFGLQADRPPCPDRVSSPPFPGRDARSTGGDPVAELEAMLAAAAGLGGTAWHEVGGQRLHQALDVLEQLDRHLAGVRAGVLSTIENEACGHWMDNAPSSPGSSSAPTPPPPRPPAKSATPAPYATTCP